LIGVSNGSLRGRVLFGFASTGVLVLRFFLVFFVVVFLGAFFAVVFLVVFAFAFDLLVELDFDLLVSFLDLVFFFVLDVFSGTVVT